MKKSVIIAIICVIILAGFLTFKMTGNTISNKITKVELETNYGNIVLELYPNKSPITVENFLTYVKEGHYDGTIFHRVISGFMIQGGGYTKDGEEKSTHAPIKLESNNGLKNNKGTIAMARTMVADSATSQFFINVADNDFLNYGSRDEGYAVFGKVIEGMDVVDKIAEVSTDAGDKPLENIEIIKAKILEWNHLKL